MIWGKYDFGDHVFIDSKYTYDQEDVKYHELAHHAITQGSLFGILEIALKQISIWFAPDVKNILAELSNSSIITQEMTAIYAQCLFYKLHGEKELEAFERHLHKSDYYRKYCIPGFDEIVHYKQYDLDGTSLLTAVAVMALNIDITLIELNWRDVFQIRKNIWINRVQNYVDHRYRLLIEAVVQLIRQGEYLTEEKILRVSGITCLKRSYDNLTNMLHRLVKQISSQYNIDRDMLQTKINSLMESKDELSRKPDISEIEQRVLPALLNDQYVFPPSDAANFNSMMSSVTVALHDKSFINAGVGSESNKTDCLVFHHAAIGWRYPVIFERNETIRFLAEFQGEIIVFTEDYDEFKRDISLHSNRRVFYRYDGMWKDFVGQIRSHKTPYIHLHEINSLINCVFVINENNEVFFTLQLKEITPYIIKDIRQGNMIYANISGDNKNIKDCFYLTDTDWCRYENVIASVINRNFMDFSEGFPTIGGRFDI